MITQLRLWLTHELFLWALKVVPDEKEYRSKLEDAFLIYTQYSLPQWNADLDDITPRTKQPPGEGHTPHTPAPS